ncbi:MAG: hypothetical protein HETSPECPRED_010027 [Heterodermia speciosa]|uniref:Uncharacterized protein n=1 Tax=Heterodermia speciosa TaxID=116794 RepID=A0A8H3G3Z3_9LECA|nr:MAG: hypothetical protein HETSPECPRED_010027 [Heterodermia speciosa]
MSSINKLTPSAISNTFEIAPALANLNFDFSIWKTEAPKEFDGVGSSLSTVRRDEAENGTPHVTARKLGALFASTLPSTPNVTKAYGQRASEISQESSVSPQTRSKYGVFSSRVGSDATSIWAAATSGPAAIAVHLLACLLAKMWDGPEATAIWAEIVQRRKELIRLEMEENSITEMTTLAAARQDITRAQLAEWDASARSWMRTADQVKSRQQKQLMLIVDNVKGSVNKMNNTYESVLAAWKSSLTQMEGLIQGISQQATSGDILLALSAWHLFPDMLVVVPCKTQVRQHDQLFESGGVLTIGLEKPDLDNSGVSWSLPLARLRHYGAPVVSSCSINSHERSRLSLTEFLQAFLGSFLHGWGDAALDTLRAVQWLDHISHVLDDTAAAGLLEAEAMISAGAKYSWLNLLFSAARYHLDCQGNEKLVAKKLVSLGRKHGKPFLGIPKLPMFGLLDRGSFVSLLREEDDQVAFLRKVAENICQELQLDSHQMFIRYRHKCPGSSKFTYEYATALPWDRSSTKRMHDRSEHKSQIHRRWLYAGSADLRKGRSSDARYEKRLDISYRSPFIYARRHVPSDFTHWHGNFSGNGKTSYLSDREYFDAADCNLIQQDFDSRANVYSAIGEEILKRESQSIEDFEVARMGIFWENMGDMDSYSDQTPWFQYLYGDIHKAAIFVLEGKGKLINLLRTPKQDSLDMYTLFEAGKMEQFTVVSRLAWHFQTAEVEADPYMQSAKAVSTAAMTYSNFPDATIDIRVLQCKLWQAQWVKSAVSELFISQRNLQSSRVTPLSLEPYRLNRACAFSCITMFESGHYDANPSELVNVMAMSSGDSLFVGSALLCDPSLESYSADIKRIAGNIGRPGIAFLVPPVAPLMRDVSISDWPQLGSFEFDGIPRDCFNGTSLHLSFTGASSPVNVGFSGAQDADVYMLETLVSVHDSGKWVADLNVLDTFRSQHLVFIPPCTDQHHNATTLSSTYNITCIENWLELIDELDRQICMVQAHGNWEARLAATSISIAKSHHTIIIPEKICWECFGNEINQISVTVRPLVAVL